MDGRVLGQAAYLCVVGGDLLVELLVFFYRSFQLCCRRRQRPLRAQLNPALDPEQELRRHTHTHTERSVPMTSPDLFPCKDALVTCSAPWWKPVAMASVLLRSSSAVVRDFQSSCNLDDTKAILSAP